MRRSKGRSLVGVSAGTEPCYTGALLPKPDTRIARGGVRRRVLRTRRGLRDTDKTWLRGETGFFLGWRGHSAKNDCAKFDASESFFTLLDIDSLN